MFMTLPKRYLVFLTVSEDIFIHEATHKPPIDKIRKSITRNTWSHHKPRITKYENNALNFLLITAKMFFFIGRCGLQH